MKKYRLTLILIIIAMIATTLYLYSRKLSPTKKITSEISQTPTPKSMPMLSPTQTPTAVQTANYPLHTRIYATMFWVGEKATDENDYIPNMESAWDKDWLEHFGGVDNPYSRKGYYPSEFKPKENPFYFALPYNDLAEVGRKPNASSIPWYDPDLPEEYSLLKNRWIKINYKSKTCYAQWEDVGPFETDDFNYVFGQAKPKNTRAGIDLSPALKDCLQMVTNDFVDWQFVDSNNVPSGPWKEKVTTSQTNF